MPVDWLQNDPTRSTVAPYSLRATPRPSVSAPVTWEEVEAGRDIRVDPAQARERIRRHGDLWRPLLRAGAAAT